MDKPEINRELARILPPPPNVAIFFFLDTTPVWGTQWIHGLHHTFLRR